MDCLAVSTSDSISARMVLMDFRVFVFGPGYQSGTGRVKAAQRFSSLEGDDLRLPLKPHSPLHVIPGWSRVSGGGEGDPAVTAMQGAGALALEAP